MRIAALALFVSAAASGPALAGACDDVKAAFDRLAAAPQVRQTIRMGDMPPMRMVALETALYLDQGEGTWVTLPLQPGARAEMMAQTMPDASALRDCREAGSEQVEGIDTTIFVFLPPSFGGEPPTLQRLWVGEDGRPYRMETTVDGGPMEMTMAYEGVTAPE
jgi:hypothetical protein